MSEVLARKVRASRKFADLMENDARAYLLDNDHDLEVADLLHQYVLLKSYLEEDQILLTFEPASEEYLATVRQALELFLRKMFALLQRAEYFRRKVRTALSKNAVASMQAWAELHGFALPNAKQKQDLCRTTGLNILQVSNWFANAKARKWNKKSAAPKRVAEPPAPSKRLYQSPPPALPLEDEFAFADIFTNDGNNEEDQLVPQDVLFNDDYLLLTEWLDVKL
ncbi:hypothetical protein BASA82_000298 [Batrachochytrium salamandrivorans]|nr:hypothetical protein BASA81_002561 [Batrachochytrium salamandrivorans]KAH9262651.1 hypothetical protein BASA82_000298 [Batrachochytrium salamandrivorans]